MQIGIASDMNRIIQVIELNKMRTITFFLLFNLLYLIVNANETSPALSLTITDVTMEQINEVEITYDMEGDDAAFVTLMEEIGPE